MLTAFSGAAYAQQYADQADSEKTEQAAETTETKAGAGAKTANGKTASSASQEKTEPVRTVEISGSRNYDERRLDTATKIVVTQEEIVKFGDSTVGDVLKRLPGITIGGVQGRGGDIRMRGLGAGYTQILLNGEPSPPGFSLDSIAPELIERIEIMRAATAEYSTQAIAGAINIVLKKAIQTAQREIKLGAANEHGVWSGSANLQLSDRLGKLSYSLAGSMFHGRWDRPSTIDEIGTDAAGNQNLARHYVDESHGRFEGINISPRLNWVLPNGDNLTSQSFVNHNESEGNTQENVLSSKEDAPLYSSNSQLFKSRSNMFRTDINWIHKLNEGAKLDVKFGANYNKRDSDINYKGYNSDSILALDRVTTTDATDKGVSFSGKYSTPIIADHSLVAGWDGGYSERGEDRLQNDTTYTGIAPINLNENFDAKVTRLALFAQDEWNVTQRWSVYMGLRWETLDTTSEGKLFDAVHNRSAVWSPLLQTLWKLPDSKNDQLRFGLTRTYKAPSTGSLIPRRYISNNNSAVSPDSMGNPNLRPELAWGLDAAYEHYLPDGGMMSASVFVRRIDDITRQRLSQIDGIWVTMPVNDGQATTRGIELEAKLPLRSLYKTGPAIDIRANLSFNWSNLSTVPGPNNRLDSQTPISANLGMDYKVAAMPLTLGGNLSFQDGGPVRLSQTQSAYAAPKRVLDMYGLWKFDAKTQLRISLANMLHQDNIAASIYADNTGSQRQTTFTPTSTAVRAMLEHKF
ncbi:TonB-dependent receptor [Undibacterium sp.]|uniref:TonB-dependent receptor plug domain-containing protein n=1 Tax=Undibacterium sp. TaxID=1914977 RepID=UPI002C4D3EE0|nr:TonB-dependent receptor [Undibacterium sp.]HTD05027.1 TonB-dependent receptor [Undibacterium sp.]